jgi:4-hydroxyphenylacetate 3-monooxygenase
MQATGVQLALRDGAAFKESLRDGRMVYVGARVVEDVTTEPSLGPGIDLMAEMFDAQFDPATEDATTYVDAELGTRVSRSWQAPTTRAELVDRRRMIEFTSVKTAGTFGRPPDLGPTIGIGLLARKPLFAGTTSDLAGDASFADNIDSYIDYARRNNIICAEVLSDPQADRSRASNDHPGLLRVTEVLADGVVVNGAKSVGSLSAQANEIIFTNFARPDAPPEAYIWAATPSNAEGVKLVCREGVGHPGADPFDHPLAARGEESDQLIIFDDVFLPNERIFNLGVPALGNLYGPVTVWAHWHILTRLWVKAKIIAGAAQAVVDALGTGQVAAVRSMVGDLIEFEEALKAFVIAAENLAAPAESGILAPDVNLLTSGRLYGIKEYPRVIHTLQELCGQGLVMRFPKAAFDHPELGPRLAELLPGHGITAADKNRLMNFVWDLTSSSQAGRTELFENVNATPVPLLQQRLYDDYDTTVVQGMVRELAGLVCA